MQILLVIVLLVALLGFIIYKINGQFGKKEGIILFVVIVVSILVFTMYEKNQDTRLPNLFKNHYQIQKGITIQKLSSELINNKYVSSKNNFIYKFTYIINKEGKEYLCTANNVQIQKIEDEYIFNTWEEECTAK